MTQQEEQLIQGLIDRVNGTQLQGKDPEAERAITAALGSNPNALYILCQTVLVQQFALENSQHELETLRTQMQQIQQQPPAEEKHTSFLGSIFGKKEDAPQQQTQQGSGYAPVHDPYGAQQPQYGGTPQQYGGTPQQYPPQQYGQQYPPQQYGGQPYPPQPGYGYPQQPPPPTGYGYGGGAPMGGGMFGGGGGFLAGAAQTAAGVVAGEMAFRAIEDVFSGGGRERGFADSRPEVINNYYDDNNRGSGDSFGDRLASADDYKGGVSSDIEDRRGEASGFLGGNDDSNDTSSFADDNSDDNSGDFDSSYDDNSGGFDDGGGSDDN